MEAVPNFALGEEAVAPDARIETGSLQPTPMTNDVAPPADATIRVASKHKTTKPPDGVFTEIGLALDTLFRSVFGSAPSSEAN